MSTYPNQMDIDRVGQTIRTIITEKKDKYSQLAEQALVQVQQQEYCAVTSGNLKTQMNRIGSTMEIGNVNIV